MSAQDNLNPQQFYHGTRYSFKPGDVLEGGAQPANNPGVGKYEHVYMATSKYGASAAGSLARDTLGNRRGMPNVYEVRPEGDPEPDPFTKGAWRSKKAVVVKQVPYTTKDDSEDG